MAGIVFAKIGIWQAAGLMAGLDVVKPLGFGKSGKFLPALVGDQVGRGFMQGD